MPNRNSKPATVSASSLLRPGTLRSIARSSGLVVRSSRKFDAASFTMAMLGSVSRGASSLNHIAVALAGFAPEPMSRQAVAKRLSGKS